ncbi:MAG: glycosyltransferase family 1 protein, partial [Cyclobacteriaceae bacterium]|nr:glycosyltransferase family 1 protein [Cyclobacteriaceae bacterium]
MKIAIATNKSWNIYNFRKGLVQSFLEAGHEVVAIAPRDAYTPFLEEWGCSYQEIQLTGTGTHPWEELQVVRRFRKIVTECGADILLTYTIKINIYGILAARNAGIPIICNVSGLGTVFLWKGLVSYVARILY